MSNDLRIRATIDGQEFENGLTGFAKRLKDLRDQGKQTGKSLSDMLILPNSGQTYQRQLMKLQKTLADITITYREMSDAEKQTDFGKQLKQTMDELTAKASQWRDAVGDVQQAIMKGASDTLYFDALSQGIELASSAVETFAGVVGMSKGNVEALTGAIAKMKTIQAASATITKTINALQKNQSSIMQVVTILQNKAAAAAAKQATATGAATVAQKAFNKVANANPYVLLASAIVAVGTALVFFAKKQNEAKAAEEAQQKKLEAEKKSFDDYAGAVASGAAKLFTTYNKLRVEYSKLVTETAKTKWIKDNKTELDSLGIAVQNVSDAENIFIKNTDKMIKAFSLRSKAAAYGKLAEDAYAEVIKRDEYLAAKLVKRGDKANVTSVKKDANSNTYNDGTLQYSPNTGAYHYTEKGAKQYNDTIKNSDAVTNKFTKRAEEYVNKMVNLESSAASLLKSAGIGTAIVNNTNELKALDGSIAAYEKKISELKDKQSKLSKNSVEYANYQKEIDALQKYIDAIKNGTADKVKLQKDAYNQIKEIQKRQAAGFITEAEAATEEIAVLKKYNETVLKSVDSVDQLTAAENDNIKKNIQRIATLNNLIATEKERQKLKDFHVEVKDIGKASVQREEPLREVKTYDINKSRKETNLSNAINQYNDLKKQLDKLAGTYDTLMQKKAAGFELNDNDTKFITAYEKQIDKLGELRAEYDKAALSVEKFNESQAKITAFSTFTGSIGSVVSSINSMYESFKNMDTALESAENGWEAFMVYFNAAMSILDGAVSIIDAINNVTKVCAFFSELIADKKLKEAAANKAAAASTVEDTIATDANAASKGVDAAATDADATAKGVDIAVTDASAVSKGADAIATDVDAAAKGADAIATDVDATAKGVDVAITDASAVSKGIDAAVTNVDAAAKGADAVASTTAAAAKGIETAATSVDTTAKAANAIAGAASSQSGVPLIGPILAAAAVAAIVALLVSSMAKFADGGIVSGSRSIGDFNIARVNGGEMILNSAQQRRLWKVLDGQTAITSNTNGGGKVEFEIKGDKLKGVLKNYENKRAKV